MSLVITVVLFGWFASALVRSADRKRQAKREAKIKAEQKRQREELKQQREDAKVWARQQVEIQREQIRQAKEQERLDAKIEKERQERIEADLKLEKRIATLEMKIEQADLDIGIEQENLDRFSAKLSRLDEDLNHANFEIEAWQKQRHPANVAKAEEKRDKIKDSIYIWEDRVRKAEKRLAKAQRTKSMLENELRGVA